MLINKYGVIKLCDFGISSELTSMKSSENLIEGTAVYSRPKSNQLSIKDDMWALAVSLIEIFDGKQPYQHSHLEQSLFQIQLKGFTLPQNMSTDTKTLIEDL